MLVLISGNDVLVQRVQSTATENGNWKCSEFNYIKKGSKDYLVYNTLYNSLLRLEQEEYEELCTPNTEALHKDVWIENGLWVPKEYPERSDYIEAAQEISANQKRQIYLTITTTLKCNAGCPYCYEKRVKKVDMAPDGVDKIHTFIQGLDTSEGIRVNWFGGEPLLNTELMDRVSGMLLFRGISYESFLITNGSLLSETMIKEKFPIWKVRDVQISLDGTKEAYESCKKYQEPDMYEKVMENIELLAKHGVYVNIRLNTHSENREDILRLAKELEERFGENDLVTYYPAFLSGTENPLTEEQRVNFAGQLIQSSGNTKKLMSASKFYSVPRMNACMKHDPYCFSVDVNGNLFDCEQYVGRARAAIGTLTSWSYTADKRMYRYELPAECNTCVFLPKCFGGCEANRRKGEDACLIDKYMIMAYMDYLAKN